jgi:hypothetical protein
MLESYCLPFPSRRINPAELMAASRSTPETIWDPIMFSAFPVADLIDFYRSRKLEVSSTRKTVDNFKGAVLQIDISELL